MNKQTYLPLCKQLRVGLWALQKKVLLKNPRSAPGIVKVQCRMMRNDYFCIHKGTSARCGLTKYNQWNLIIMQQNVSAKNWWKIIIQYAALENNNRSWFEPKNHEWFRHLAHQPTHLNLQKNKRIYFPFFRFVFRAGLKRFVLCTVILICKRIYCCTVFILSTGVDSEHF